MPAVPKELHHRPKAERGINPFKPTFAKKANSTLKPISDKRLAKLGGKLPSTTFASADSEARLRRGHIRWTVKPWRLPPAKTHEWGDKARRKLRQISAKQRVKIKALAELKVQMLKIWDQGCIFNFLGSCEGPIEMAHGHSKGARPDLALNAGNVFPACRSHHETGRHNAHNYGPYIHALEAAADLMLAAVDGRRPQPSWGELQAKMRRVIGREERSQRRTQER